MLAFQHIVACDYFSFPGFSFFWHLSASVALCASAFPRLTMASRCQNKLSCWAVSVGGVEVHFNSLRAVCSSHGISQPQMHEKFLA